VLHLQMKRAMKNLGAVHVDIDGVAHSHSFGSAFFEIPADRPVTVRIHQLDVLRHVFGSAMTVLEPGAPAELEYQAPAHNKVKGEIGPPGTTRVRGRGRFFLFLGAIIVVPIVVAFVAIVILFMLAL